MLNYSRKECIHLLLCCFLRGEVVLLWLSFSRFHLISNLSLKNTSKMKQGCVQSTIQDTFVCAFSVSVNYRPGKVL